jgi:hypothetical protein
MDSHSINLIKGLIIGAISSIMAYLTPVHDLLVCIGLAFAGNFLWGYIAGLVVQSDSFCLKKAKVAIYEVVIYCALIAFIYTIGEKMNNKDLALKSLAIITWAWIYFYLVNIFKNLKRLFPTSRGLAFVYFVISLEFNKQFPYLKEFVESEKQQVKN